MPAMSDPITVRLRSDIEQRIRRIATDEGNTVGAVVRRLLVVGLKSSPDDDAHQFGQNQKARQ